MTEGVGSFLIPVSLITKQVSAEVAPYNMKICNFDVFDICNITKLVKGLDIKS